MRKSLLVARQAYLHSVRHPAYWAFTVGLPLSLLLGIVLMAALAVQFVLSDRRPIAYVDESGALLPAAAWLAEAREPMWVDMLAAADESAARAAYEAGHVQAYYVVAADYVETGRVREVTNGLGALRVRSQVVAYLRQGLLHATPPHHRARIAEGTILLHRSPGALGEQGMQNGLQWGLAGFVVIAFWLINATSSSDALYALHDEAREHTLEMALASVTTQEFIAGKVLGVVAAGLTQFAAWAAVAAVAVAGLLISLAQRGIVLSLAPAWSLLVLSLGLCLPAFIMNVAGLVLFSALAELAGRGERVVWSIINLAAFFAGPLAFVAVSAPDHPAAIALSLLPFSAPLVMVVRYAQIAVPAWQVGLALTLVWGAAVFNLVFVARVYRATWLRQGHAGWRQLLPVRVAKGSPQ